MLYSKKMLLDCKLFWYKNSKKWAHFSYTILNSQRSMDAESNPSPTISLKPANSIHPTRAHVQTIFNIVEPPRRGLNGSSVERAHKILLHAGDILRSGMPPLLPLPGRTIMGNKFFQTETPGHLTSEGKNFWLYRFTFFKCTYGTFGGAISVNHSEMSAPN